uniref:DUF8040 domain-containing protein n=1 Tax=Chenopodium quinoa TaxID=63459 RepID=A0A803M7V2_CHEQI
KGKQAVVAFAAASASAKAKGKGPMSYSQPAPKMRKLSGIRWAKDYRNITVKESVALFLRTLAHALKNRTMQALFARSGETVSRQSHAVLASMLKLLGNYIIEADHTTSYVDDNRWKWFKGVIGALDGTHIDMIVPIED